jgi:hypothetical protein
MKKEWKKVIVDKQTKLEVEKIPDWKIINLCKEIAKTGANNLSFNAQLSAPKGSTLK